MRKGKSVIETYFDTPERTEQADILRKNSFISSYEIILQMLESYPQLALIIDSNRQIIAANKNALKFLASSNLFEVLGKRLGEALNCIHAFEMKAGCGTSVFCTECGAAKSIKETKDNNIQAMYECRVTSKRNNVLLALDLRVITTPLNISEEKYLLVYLENIEAEKRKDTLERVFFHDVLNTAGAIKNIVDILPEIKEEDELLTFIDMLKSSSSQLLNEIIFQRMIINAEKNELSVDLKTHNVNSILESSYSLYSRHQKAEGKYFEIDYLENDISIQTDKTILIRSLGNLIKNALEATSQGKKIKLFATLKNDFIYFNVWNEGVIPEEVQLQIFQRSFSTKAKSGRGIGTYSVKLFVENYLKGKVFFTSSDSEQTCFTIALPFKKDI